MVSRKVIAVNVEVGEAGLFHATSEQLKELFVSGESLNELKESVPIVVQAIFDAQGSGFSVLEADESESVVTSPWMIHADAIHP